jgi:hypothetical protein
MKDAEDRGLGFPEQPISAEVVDWSKLTPEHRKAVLAAMVDNADHEADEG